MKEIEATPGLDLFDLGVSPLPSADVTGGPPAPLGEPPPASPGPPPERPGPQLPAWLSDIPEGERAQVIGSGLSALSVEQLLQLEPVRELLGQAQNLAATQAANQQRQNQAQEQRQQYLMQEAQGFEQALSPFVPDDFGLRERTDNYTLAVQQDYHQYLAGQVQKGILDNFSHLGIQSLPPSLTAQVGAARSYDEVVKAYMDTAAERGFELGRIKERNDSGSRSRADELALRARTRNEVLGQLAKEGRVALGQDDQGYFAQLQAESTPPPLSGAPVSGSADLDDDEVRAALADPDAYERLMGDPIKARAFNKAMAGEMARQ